MSNAGSFSYAAAFARNIGWVTPAEQLRLQGSRVAIAGVGGVGGSYALTLARLGVGGFTLADPDVFDWPNLNRQAGAFASTIGRRKIDTIADTLSDINPDVRLTTMPGGVTLDTVDEFLEGADLYLDGLDIFAMDIRRRVFARCRELGIPAVTVAPMGMGAALVVFAPAGMSFDDYFRLDGLPLEDQILLFIIGVSPTMQQRHYLLDRGSVNLLSERVPSTVLGIELAAGVAGTTALKLLLGRGGVAAAPRGMHVDAYRGTVRRTWRPGGNNNPIQRAMYWYVRNRLAKAARGRQNDAT